MYVTVCDSQTNLVIIEKYNFKIFYKNPFSAWYVPCLVNSKIFQYILDFIYVADLLNQLCLSFKIFFRRILQSVHNVYIREYPNDISPPYTLYRVVIYQVGPPSYIMNSGCYHIAENIGRINIGKIKKLTKFSPSILWNL